MKFPQIIFSKIFSKIFRKIFSKKNLRKKFTFFENFGIKLIFENSVFENLIFKN